MNNVKSILLVGVGGQGILLSSEVLSEILIRMNYDIKKNEIHGMAQRGGTVTSQIRYGEKVYSPKIPDRGCEMIVSLEYMESARFLNLLAPGGIILSSSQKIIPSVVSSGQGKYPENIEDYYKKNHINCSFIPAHQFAEELGNMKVINIIMMGYLNQKLQFPVEVWETVLKEKVKPKFIDLNLKAFHKGFTYKGE